MSAPSPFFSMFSLMILFLPILLGCRPESRKNSESITIKGSDTMVYLVSAWAEGYMQQHPQAVISVTGGGTRSGIAAFLNQTTDLIAASRELKPSELQAMPPEKITVAWDGIVIIVNQENPIEILTLDQLKTIFTGTANNWREFTGVNQPILIYSRESSSGTYEFFREAVLHNEDYSSSARLMPATSGILAAVAADIGGIGYVGLGHAEHANVKILAVKPSTNQPAITPTSASISNGEYPISRALYLFMRKDSSNAVHEFVQFTQSEQGQRVVEENGYISIKR